MNIQQMKYVLSIATHGTFSKAAQVLYITQPTLSNEVKKLEKELGIEIFQRGKTGATLTEEGREFLEYARSIIEQFECMEERYVTYTRQEIFFSVANQHNPCAVEAFLRLLERHKDNSYQMKMLEGRTRDVIQYVRDGVCDIGILVRDQKNKVLDKEILQYNLDYEALACFRPHVYLSETHPLAKRASVSKEDMAPYPFMIYDQGGDSWANFAEEIDGDLIKSQILVVTDRSTQISLSLSANAYTIGTGVLGAHASTDKMVSVLYETDSGDIELGWLKRQDRRMTEYMEEYIAHFRRLLECH